MNVDDITALECFLGLETLKTPLTGHICYCCPFAASRASQENSEPPVSTASSKSTKTKGCDGLLL